MRHIISAEVEKDFGFKPDFEKAMAYIKDGKPVLRGLEATMYESEKK